MFAIFKRKVKIPLKPIIYRCSVCNRKFKEIENIDLLYSRRKDRCVCKQCMDYLERK